MLRNSSSLVFKVDICERQDGFNVVDDSLEILTNEGLANSDATQENLVGKHSRAEFWVDIRKGDLFG